ncbi:MAG: hypothetical protein U5K27_02120 [Desulfotignum sp.]|nr:hypothetical protein [Desulfotignum sp.]
MELRRSQAPDPDRFLYRGRMPGTLGQQAPDHDELTSESYVRTYVERDLKTIIDVENLSDFRRFFRVAATPGPAGCSITRGLAAVCGVSDVTIENCWPAPSK